MQQTECPNTNYEDLIGVACPQCGQVFPEDHNAGCGILWPMSGARMTTPKPSVTCGVCGDPLGYPVDDTVPRTADGKPVHGFCAMRMPRPEVKPVHAENGEHRPVPTRDPDPNNGPCALCGKDVVSARPWWVHEPQHPSGKGKPLHDECQQKWDNISIRVTPNPTGEKVAAPEPPPKHVQAYNSNPPQSLYQESAYTEPTHTQDKVAELQGEDESLKVLQARAKIAKCLGEAVVEFGVIAPDQQTYDDYAKALGVLQQVALNGKDAVRDEPFFKETRMVAAPMQVAGPKVFVGRPYVGEVDDGAALAAYAYPYRNPDSILQVTIERQHSSALCYSFNRCWAAMFCHAKFPFDWFVLQHQDIEPEGPWIDMLIEEAEKGGYDVMTAVSPLKDDRGVSSTAWGSMEHDWDRMRRITLLEKDTQLPETFGIDELVKVLGSDGMRGTPCFLNNTGIMAIRVKEKRLKFNPASGVKVGPFAVGVSDAKRGLWPWCFPGWRMHDKIDFSRGYCSAEFISEDWDMGRWCARHGLKVGATSRIDLGHYGRSCFRNRWDKGQQHDEAFMAHARGLAEAALKDQVVSNR